jgi:hypothetical protein
MLSQGGGILARWIQPMAARRVDWWSGAKCPAGNPVRAYLFTSVRLQTDARRLQGGKAVAIPVGEQLNLMQQVSCHRISLSLTPSSLGSGLFFGSHDGM